MNLIKKKKQGFTLIEVAIGLTIATMLIGGVYSMVISSLKNTSKNEEKQTAALFTQQLMEELKGITVELDKNNNMTLSNSFNLIQDPIDNKKYKACQNGYEAEIEINKNLVTIGKKDTDDSYKDSSFCSEVKIGDDLIINDSVHNRIVINILAFINESDNFEISFIDESNMELYNIRSNETSSEKSTIMLDMNFENYTPNNDNKVIQLNVFNRTNKEFLLTAFKAEDLSIQANSKVGNLSFLDNQSSNINEYTQLYDITVTIEKDGDKILETKSSQNLNVNMVGD